MIYIYKAIDPIACYLETIKGTNNRLIVSDWSFKDEFLYDIRRKNILDDYNIVESNKNIIAIPNYHYLHNINGIEVDDMFILIHESGYVPIVADFREVVYSIIEGYNHRSNIHLIYDYSNYRRMNIERRIITFPFEIPILNYQKNSIRVNRDININSNMLIEFDKHYFSLNRK